MFPNNVPSLPKNTPHPLISVYTMMIARPGVEGGVDVDTRVWSSALQW